MRAVRFAATTRGPGAVTPASVAARSAVRKRPSPSPPQVSLRCERTGGDAGTPTRGGKTCLFGVTHLVGVLGVEAGLHVLFLLGRSRLAAMAGGGPSLPLRACTHHHSLNIRRQTKPGSGAALMWLSSRSRRHFLRR